MRGSDSFILFASPQGWRAVEVGGGRELVRVDAGAAVDVAADQLVASLAADGRRSPQVIVAPASPDCFAVTLATEGLPRRGTRRALFYRLEEQLPIAAEDVLADFVPHNGVALGICSAGGELGALIDSLAARGVDTLAVCPAPLLALQWLLSGAGARPDADVIVWQHDDVAELFRLDEETVAAWQTWPVTRGDLALALGALALEKQSPLRIATVSLDALDLADIPDLQVTALPALEMEVAARRAAQGLARRGEPQLASLLPESGGAGHPSRRLRQSAAAAAIAFVLLSLCTIGSVVWRATLYGRAVAAAEKQKQEVFRRLFPGQPVPVGIMSRLRSLESRTRPANEPWATSAAPGASALLYRVLGALPADLRFRVEQMDAGVARVALDGEVKSHADAQALAAVLRASGLSVEDPQTQQTSNGLVSFSIAAQLMTQQNPKAASR